jgi:hypothetical protein
MLFLTFYAANLLTYRYVPANGIELIVLPLHDGQILVTSGRKKDAFQKQWLQRANWTCFEISPPFVIGSRFAIMVVVVVIVLNYTSPKVHKPPSGDIDSCMHLIIWWHSFILTPDILSDLNVAQLLCNCSIQSNKMICHVAHERFSRSQRFLEVTLSFSLS